MARRVQQYADRDNTLAVRHHLAREAEFQQLDLITCEKQILQEGLNIQKEPSDVTFIYIRIFSHPPGFEIEVHAVRVLF